MSSFCGSSFCIKYVNFYQIAFALQKILTFLQQNINVFEKTLATIVSKFVINKLVKLIYVIPPDLEIISMVMLPFR